MKLSFAGGSSNVYQLVGGDVILSRIKKKKRNQTRRKVRHVWGQVLSHEHFLPGDIPAMASGTAFGNCLGFKNSK